MKHLNLLEQLMKYYVEQQADDRRFPEWGRRAVLQMMYAAKLSEVQEHTADELVDQAIEQAWQAHTGDGGIVRETCLQVEQTLAPLAELAKSYTLICVGHAHIDMNWMWSYDETVSITLDTFRTMLALMDEYPGFTYAQSQASVYEIVARHDPDLLQRIKQRVHEGRWEVTASTWVEADRNMPSAESMVRHFLYARRFLADLLDIDPATLDLDYEPDTFGHHEQVPEILSDAGVRYYYHCRGADVPVLYRWQAPSGRSIITYREPLWYNWDMDGRCALIVPGFCQSVGLKTALRVYGVGDHGGGPTRRDIERIIRMDAWPIFPRYRFGRYHDFFQSVEAVVDQLPVIKGELNFIFDGCYTTQTRIKRGNRRSEQALFAAESAAALTSFATDFAYPATDFKQAWQKVLFNQFHDILPGSGTADTREHAMAQYQEAYALTNTQNMKALRVLAGRIDTQALSLPEDLQASRSEGAGVGYPTGSGNLPRTAWHGGLRRLFMVWNPLPHEREQLCELTLWDWSGDSSRIQVRDGYGQILPHQVASSGKESYWGHRFQNILISVRVPASGYRTVVVDELPLQSIAVKAYDVRTIKPDNTVLENEYLKVVVSPQDGSILSLFDKERGYDYADPKDPTAIFRLIQEDASRGMTAWVVGAYQQIRSLHQSVRLTDRNFGPLRQQLTWMTTFGNQSDLTVTLTLDRGERLLRLRAAVRWQEIGSLSGGLPQLNFYLPLPWSPSAYRYSIPMGEIERPPLPHDVPATAYVLAAGKSSDARALMLVSDSKYGFRGTPEGLSMTLIRSSIDPDPWPEVGAHQVDIAIALVDDDRVQPGLTAQTFNSPLHALPLQQDQTGDRPLQASMFSLSGQGVWASAVKRSEDGQALIVRLYSLSDQPEAAHLVFWSRPEQAVLTDLMERPLQQEENLPEINGPAVRVVVPPRSLLTLRLAW